jgi:hypothetical protein
MRKIVKFILVVIMFIGIAFSIINFISLDAKASKGLQGVWDYDNGVRKCLGIGDECNICFPE